MTDDECPMTELPRSMCAHCKGYDPLPGQRALFVVNPDSYTVLAVRESICRACNDDVLAGDSITRTDGGWVHTECVGSA